MRGRKMKGELTYQPNASGKFFCNQPGPWPIKIRHPRKHRRIYEAPLPVLIRQLETEEAMKKRDQFLRRQEARRQKREIEDLIKASTYQYVNKIPDISVELAYRANRGRR